MYLTSERRDDLVNKLLQLGNLVSPGKAYAQIGHTGGLIALQRVDDQARWAKPHEPAIMYPAAVVLLQKRARQRFSLGDIGVEAHGRIHAHGETKQGAPVLRQGLLAARTECAAVVISKIGGNNAITETGEAVELGRDNLASVASRDQDGWTSLVPGQRTNGVLGQLHVMPDVRDRLTAPELAPDDDVLFEILAPPLVYTPARLPLAGDLGKPPPYPEAQHQAPVRNLVDVCEGMRQ